MIKAFLYWSTVNRNCVICGKPHSDLAHRFAVGRGRDRTKINHFGNQILALCRSHHNEQHQIGMDTFNNKYHLTDSWVDVDERLNKMLKGDFMSDRLIDITGGYGTVYKEVLKDKDGIEAKAIYSYLSSYAGGKDTAFLVSG